VKSAIVCYKQLKLGKTVMNSMKIGGN
jgi:hypothetical protein